MSEDGSPPETGLYLKDWHFPRMSRAFESSEVDPTRAPDFFSDDWLNWWYVSSLSRPIAWRPIYLNKDTISFLPCSPPDPRMGDFRIDGDTIYCRRHRSRLTKASTMNIDRMLRRRVFPRGSLFVLRVYVHLLLYLYHDGIP